MTSSLFRPDDLRLDESTAGGGHLLVLPPRRAQAVPLVGFALVWNAFLVVWYMIAVGAGGGPGGIALWFPILHVGVGLFVAWQALIKLFNRTRIRLDRDRFTVEIGPVPQGGNLAEATVGLLRFEPGQGQPRASTNRRQAPAWNVFALTEDGRRLELRLELPTDAHASYLAGRLNRVLDEVRAPSGYRE